MKTSTLTIENRDRSIAAEPGPVTAGAGSDRVPLVVNTRFASAGPVGPVLGPERGNTQGNAGGPVAGLLRAKIGPRGAEIGKLTPEELQVYKRALRWQRLRAVQHMLSDHRVSKCYRVRIKPNAEILRSQKAKRAFYGGLVICGSVWSCPVCSAKITERRKNEIENAPHINDFSKFMVTYTIQHNRNDSLKALYADLSAGLHAMTGTRAYVAFREKYQLVGQIIGAEDTVSNVAGWHPHKHALMFPTLPQAQINAEEIQIELAQLL